MAQLNSRGTLTRGRWDFFERSNGVAFVYGSVGAGPIGAYFANNATSGAAIDIYAIHGSSNNAVNWDTFILLPPIAGVALTPIESWVSCVKPDEAVPAGVIGMYTSVTSVMRHLTRDSNKDQYYDLAPIAGEPFFTLPPLWGIAILSPGAPGADELSLTVWYQEVLDNIAPAR
jgi:hypothetical protein